MVVLFIGSTTFSSFKNSTFHMIFLYIRQEEKAQGKPCRNLPVSWGRGKGRAQSPFYLSLTASPASGKCHNLFKAWNKNGSGVARSKFWNRQATAYLCCQSVWYFRMSRHCFHRTGARVGPKRMPATFSLQVAAVPTKMLQESSALHCTTTVSRIASCGTPRSVSSRRSSSTRAMASARL